MYKRQAQISRRAGQDAVRTHVAQMGILLDLDFRLLAAGAVSYTHLRAHETVLDLVCRLLLEKKNPLLSTGLSHHTYLSSSAPFTPNKSAPHFTHPSYTSY